MPPAAIPVATYRLQFNAGFTFDDATAIVDYLDALGVSHCYASSYFKAVPGSGHGYDVTDPTALNPEIGDERSHRRWIDTLRAHGMGHIIDLVPNHMGISKSANPWWQDVLENGPSSRYAPVFDIEWHPLKQELENKVLLPILGDSYGAVLERQEITLEYRDGVFSARYFEHVLPIAPGTYERILSMQADALLEEIGPDSNEGVEFLSIMTAIRHLPGREVQEPQLIAERDREKEVIKKRLGALTKQSPAVLRHIERAVALCNGTPGEPRSFDSLDRLLSAQAYRLAYWRVAAEEINYRRFFDINELAAIRVEDQAVFDRVHAFAFDLLTAGLVDGFRIDHVDGLYDPGDYLHRLQSRATERRPDIYAADRPLFIVVEKILGLDEELPQWPVEGTTGYDFLAHINGIFIDQRNAGAVNSVYERFTRLRTPFQEIAYLGKQLVLRVSMAGELNIIAHELNRFSERNRHFRDFTLNSLAYAIREIIACFPVYRSYVNEREPVRERDRAFIEHAVREAKRRNPTRSPLVFDFVRDLLLKKADYIPESERDAHMRLIAKFQQVTSPVTAKGIEDTALYIYNRLASLNEVGNEPGRFGVPPDKLHAWLACRAKRWPHGLSATSTHDVKRGEDMRARLNVLSEVPGAWKQATSRWARLNRRGRSLIEGYSYPSRNEEYLLYQTLVGTWPFEPMTPEEETAYSQRIIAYMHKAMREAKVYTSWLNPSDRHEQAMTKFVEATLAPDNTAFRREFVEFQSRIAQYGIYNSLAQLALKIGAPGVPDFYQGTELWDLSLVDPDNRRPIDYETRRALLSEYQADMTGDQRHRAVTALMAQPRDPRIKVYTTSLMLRFRRAHPEVFRAGAYQPLTADGARHDHVFAFSRVLDDRQVIVAVPRLIASLLPEADVPPLGEKVWGDTSLALPPNAPQSFQHILSGRCVQVRRNGDAASVRAADVFEHFPIALLAGR